jgi:hypothetical protein
LIQSTLQAARTGAAAMLATVTLVKEAMRNMIGNRLKVIDAVVLLVVTGSGLGMMTLGARRTRR